MAGSAILKLNVIADASKAVTSLKGLSGAADDAGSKSQTFTQRLKTMGKAAAIAAGAAALGGLVLMVKTGIQEQNDFLAGQAQLAAGIKSTGNAAHVTVGGLEDLASTIQNYSGQTDDSIVAAEKLMLTFTGVRNEAGKNNDIFNQAIKVTADMAARMGGEASTYAIQLGKALNDPVKGISKLTRVGVTFNEQQIKQIKTMQASGDTLGAQKVMIKELNKEFGGSARAFGQTLPGQIERTKRKFEDVSQSLAASLLPLLTKLADIMLRDIMPAFAGLTNFITKNISWLGPLAAAITAIVIAFKAWSAATALLGISMNALPVIGWITAIVALGTALVIAYQKVGWFRTGVQTAVKLITAAVKIFIAIWKVQFNIARTIVVTVGRAIGNAIRNTVSVIARVASTIFNIWVLPYRLAWRAVRALVTTWAPAMYGWIRNVVSRIGNALGTVYNVITSPFSKAWNWVTNNVSKLWKAFSGVARAIGSELSGVFNAITRPFSDAWNWIQRNIFGPIKSGWNSIANLVNSAPTISLKAPSWVPGIGGKGWEFQFPHIPTLARGGWINAPTLAVVGEAGPEIVAPEAALRRLLRDELANLGPTIVINGALDPDAVARQIERILRGRARRVAGVAAGTVAG